MPTFQADRHPAEAAAAIARLEELRRRGEALLPVLVPAHYRRLVEEEIRILGRGEGPLYSVVFPRANRFDRVEGEADLTPVANFVEDRPHMPPGLEGVVVRRYPHKLLYFPTDACIGHCQYCFRPDITGAATKRRTRNLRPDVVERVVKYLEANPEVREVILSGGDPLACRPEELERAVARIAEVPSVRWLRAHTRSPVFNPRSLTPAFLDLFVRYRIRVVLHIVHPYEIPPARDALLALQQTGLPVYNQFPLLRGVNDHPAVVMELAYRTAELGIQMLTVFVADPIRYSSSYRLRLARVFALADEVFLRGEAWISNFRVCLDTPLGKVRREHVVDHDERRGIYVFEREGRRIEYHDIPAEVDVPSRLRDLLYRGADILHLEEWT